MNTVTDAVAESRNYNRIVTVDVDSIDAAMDAIYEAAGDDEVDYVDNGDIREVWGYDPETKDDSMTFRVHLRKAA